MSARLCPPQPGHAQSAASGLLAAPGPQKPPPVQTSNGGRAEEERNLPGTGEKGVGRGEGHPLQKTPNAAHDRPRRKACCIDHPALQNSSQHRAGDTSLPDIKEQSGLWALRIQPAPRLLQETEQVLDDPPAFLQTEKQGAVPCKGPQPWPALNSVSPPGKPGPSSENALAPMGSALGVRQQESLRSWQLLGQHVLGQSRV